MGTQYDKRDTQYDKGDTQYHRRDTQDDRARHSRRQDGIHNDRKGGMQNCHVERSETSFTLERFGAKDPSLALRMTEGTLKMTGWTLKIIGWHSR